MGEPLVVIGNGMAAARFAEELSQRALGRYATALIGDEAGFAYNRVLLSSLLAEETDLAAIELKPARWWRDQGVTVCCGVPATAIDAERRTVTLADGKQLAFAKLVFATGSQPVRLPIPGMELEGVLSFRGVGDVHAIAHTAGRGGSVVVVGGGLLGLEAAYGVARSGAQVTVIHLMDRLMERQLDPQAAAMLKRAVEAKGIGVILEAETARLSGAGRVQSVELKDGRIIAADAVVVAAGTLPNAELARSAGLKVNRGIVVDDHLQTSASGIYAIGECAEHRGLCYGLVEPAYEQARVLARRLAGEDAAYPGSVLATHLKVSGVHVFSAGDFLGAPGTEEIVLHDPGLGTYKKLVIAGQRLVGAVLFGDTSDGPWYLELIRSGTAIDCWRSDLVFGRALAERMAQRLAA